MLATSLFWIENALGNFSVQPLPIAALSGRLKSSKKPALGAMIENAWALDVDPPALAVKTVTWARPAAVMSEFGIAAVSWVVETNVVDRYAPFQRKTESRAKLLPFTVRLNPALPAIADAGLILSMAITGPA